MDCAWLLASNYLQVFQSVMTRLCCLCIATMGAVAFMVGCSPPGQVHWIMVESNLQAQGAFWQSLVNKDVDKNIFGLEGSGTSFEPYSGAVSYLNPPNSKTTRLANAYRARWQTADGKIYVVEHVPVGSVIPKETLDQARGRDGLPIEVRFAFLPEGRFRMSWRQCPSRPCFEGKGPNAGTATEFVGRLETTEPR